MGGVLGVYRPPKSTNAPPVKVLRQSKNVLHIQHGDTNVFVQWECFVSMEPKRNAAVVEVHGLTTGDLQPEVVTIAIESKN